MVIICVVKIVKNIFGILKWLIWTDRMVRCLTWQILTWTCEELTCVGQFKCDKYGHITIIVVRLDANLSQFASIQDPFIVQLNCRQIQPDRYTVVFSMRFIL